MANIWGCFLYLPFNKRNAELLRIDHMSWKIYFLLVVLVCFQDAEQSFGKAPSDLHPSQGPPFLEYQAETGF